MVQNIQLQNLIIHLYYFHHYTISNQHAQAKNFFKVFCAKENLELPKCNYTSKVSKWMIIVLSIVGAMITQLQSIVGKSGDFKS